jgi:YHS domain-containing protein
MKDPVCGMEVDPKSAFAKREHMGKHFTFARNRVWTSLTAIRTAS